MFDVPVTRQGTQPYSEQIVRDLWPKLLAEDATSFVVKARWRPSKYGGRPSATLSLTAQQLSAMARVSRSSPAATEQQQATTTISLRGPLGHSAMLVVDRVMEVVQVRTSSNLNRAQDPLAAMPGTWSHVEPEGDYRTSDRVRLHLSSKEEARKVASELHGHAINVGSDLIAVEVSNDLMDAKTTMGSSSGNGERRRPGRGPSSANH